MHADFGDLVSFRAECNIFQEKVSSLWSFWLFKLPELTGVI